MKSHYVLLLLAFVHCFTLSCQDKGRGYAQDYPNSTWKVSDSDVTALMEAASEGNEYMVRTLIDNGADVNKRDKDQWTALMYAVRYSQSYSTAKLLVDKGAYIQIRNRFNSTPLLLAATYNKNPDVISLLLKKRNGNEEEVFDAFILAIKDNVSPDYIKIAKINLFLEKGLAINGFWKGETPLMTACSQVNPSSIVKFLLINGADPSIRNENGESAYDRALVNPTFIHDETFELLRKNK